MEKVISFMINLAKEEIVSDHEYKVVEHYESDDMTLIYDVVEYIDKPGQLLKIRDIDGDLRYASFIQDGYVNAWDLMTNASVYTASADGCKHIYDKGANCWYSMNPITSDWVQRQEVAQRCDNPITKQPSELIKLEGTDAEILIAAWLHDRGWI